MYGNNNHVHSHSHPSEPIGERHSGLHQGRAVPTVGDLNISEESLSDIVSSSVEALAVLPDRTNLVDTAILFGAAHLPTRVASYGIRVDAARLDRDLSPSRLSERITRYWTLKYRAPDHRAILLQVGDSPEVRATPVSALLRSAPVVERVAALLKDTSRYIENTTPGELWRNWGKVKGNLVDDIKCLSTARVEDNYVTRASRFLCSRLEADYPSLPELGRALRVRHHSSEPTTVFDAQGNLIEGEPLRRLVFDTRSKRFASSTLRPENDETRFRLQSSACHKSKQLAETACPTSRLRGALPHSSRRSLICLVPKARGGLGLSAYRPIVLSTTVYRIVSAILHGRLRPHLPTIVPECQTYAVPGRCFSWNFGYVSDEVAIATRNKTLLAVISTDLLSAFDQMDRGFLILQLRSIDLPLAFMKCFELLYEGADATVRIEGNYTRPFKLRRELRQGCATSAALFFIFTGPLLRHLEIVLRRGNALTYADDILLLIREDWQFEVAKSIFDDIRQANSLVLASVLRHLHAYLPSDATIAKIQARLTRPVSVGGVGLLDIKSQLQPACFKGVQTARRVGSRNAYSWWVENGLWMAPMTSGAWLPPRRRRLLELWGQASSILSLNYCVVPTPTLLNLPLVGACRFLATPSLRAPSRLTRSTCDDSATLGTFCRRLMAENARSAYQERSLEEAVVLRGTATSFLRISTRTARWMLERPCLAAVPISRYLRRWGPVVDVPSTSLAFSSIRRCSFGGHAADIALQRALHALPHPGHPASSQPVCIACGSSDLSLAHRYWSCSAVRPLIREVFSIIGRPPDLQSWIFAVGLEDHSITISSVAKHAIYDFFVDRDCWGLADNLPPSSAATYIKTLENKLGKSCVGELGKASGQVLVGLERPEMAETIIEDGLMIKGALIKALPYQKKVEKITLSGLPFVIEDAEIIRTLRPYCQVVSIAPVVNSSGGYTWLDLKKTAFVLMNEGKKITDLPKKIIATTKGGSALAYLEYGFRCSKCYRMGHKRINCPRIIRKANTTQPSCIATCRLQPRLRLWLPRHRRPPCNLLKRPKLPRLSPPPGLRKPPPRQTSTSTEEEEVKQAIVSLPHRRLLLEKLNAEESLGLHLFNEKLIKGLGGSKLALYKRLSDIRKHYTILESAEDLYLGYCIFSSGVQVIGQRVLSPGKIVTIRGIKATFFYFQLSHVPDKHLQQLQAIAAATRHYIWILQGLGELLDRDNLVDAAAIFDTAHLPTRISSWGSRVDASRLYRVLSPSRLSNCVTRYWNLYHKNSDHRAVLLQIGEAAKYLETLLDEALGNIEDMQNAEIWRRWGQIEVHLASSIKSLHDLRNKDVDYISRTRKYVETKLEDVSINSDYPCLPDLGRALRLLCRGTSSTTFYDSAGIDDFLRGFTLRVTIEESDPLHRYGIGEEEIVAAVGRLPTGKAAGNRTDSPFDISWNSRKINILGTIVNPGVEISAQDQHLQELLERAIANLVLSTINYRLQAYLPSETTIARLQASILARPISVGGMGLLDVGTQLRLSFLKGVQTALRGGRNVHPWLAESGMWLSPASTPGIWLPPRRRRSLHLFEAAAEILELNHRILQPALLQTLRDPGGRNRGARDDHRLTAPNNPHRLPHAGAPSLAVLFITQLLGRWLPHDSIFISISWSSLRRCAFSGHNADVAVRLALHALPHPAHPASARESCIACGSETCHWSTATGPVGGSGQSSGRASPSFSGPLTYRAESSGMTWRTMLWPS
ncbi:hypothetical protein LAZ67_X002738 [Cordylochernes scorpioides]|uniref:Reverse transcriptase domain-containing protein n=1 Tax=Cordylochernes scorpioides TaxID=51811 RepID=A0ABY6LU28_9ARAC|nr:hypothetical protein LAZ67_X002738 [Cordylochernes scorpioides]